MTEAAPLTALPPETLDGHVGLLATSGAGKTYGAKTAVEDLLEAGRRVCVIDPTGVWWGLRADRTGEAGGFPAAIIGGDHGDVPLVDGAGAALARAVAEGAFSAVIDASRMTVGARTRLFADFAEELARVNRRPLHLVIDEAHLFMPQGRVNDFQSARMVGAANHLVAGGRALGLRMMLISQRPAKVHKDSLTQIGALVAMWMTAPQDTAAVKAWIADVADRARGQEVLASLPGLQVGEGWVWAPRAGVFSRIKFRPIRTFDSSRAPALDEVPPTARLSALPIEELRAALAAEEPGELEAQPAARPTRRPSPDELAAAEKRGYERGLADGRSAEWRLSFGEGIDLLIAELRAERGQRVEVLQAAPASPDPEPAKPRRLRQQPERVAWTIGLGASARKLLQVLRAPNLPDSARRWPDLAVLAVLAPTGGSFNAARKQLLDSGAVIDTDKGLQAIGGEGLPSAVTPDDDGAPINPAAVAEAWCTKLGGSARRILSMLYVMPANKTRIADELELAPKGGSWNAAWKTLRDNNLVEEMDDGRWRIAAVLDALKREER